MSSNYYIEEIQDYLEDLCTRHADIQHMVNGRRAFSRFQSDEHIREIQNNGASVVVVVSDFSGSRIGDFDDKKMRQILELQFAVRAEVIDDVTSAIDAAVKKAQDILFDFVTRMEHDYVADDCGPLRFLESEKVSWEKFEGPWLDNHYGWFLSIPFKSYMPAYNQEKWS